MAQDSTKVAFGASARQSRMPGRAPRKVTGAQRRARKPPATLQSGPEALQWRPKSIDLDLKQEKARIHENITIYYIFNIFGRIEGSPSRAKTQ